MGIPGAMGGTGPLSVLVVAPLHEAERWKASLLSGKQRPLEVVVLPSLERAVEALRVKPFDVLLLGLALPCEEAFQVLLRARALGFRLPIVVVTGYDDPELAQQAVQAGVQDYLVEAEIGPGSLARALRYAVIRHRLLTEARRVREFTSRAFHDPLTGLASRNAFLRRTDHAIGFARRCGERPALVLLSLDRFASTASWLGPVGVARVLQEVGRRLLWCVRRSDFVARLGADRFGVLLPHVVQPIFVLAVAERIRTAAAAAFELEAVSARLTASLGCASFPEDGDTAEALIEAAELAHGEAKRAGGNSSRRPRPQALEDLSFLITPAARPAREPWTLAGPAAASLPLPRRVAAGGRER